MPQPAADGTSGRRWHPQPGRGVQKEFRSGSCKLSPASGPERGRAAACSAYRVSANEGDGVRGLLGSAPQHNPGFQA